MDQKSLRQIEELLDRKLDEKFTERLSPINGRLDNLETRFEGLEKRFDGLETRFDNFDKRLTKVEGWEPYFINIMDIVGRINVDVYDMKIRLESHDRQLEEHDIKLDRIIRLLPDTRAEIYELNGRVKKLEEKAG